MQFLHRIMIGNRYRVCLQSTDNATAVFRHPGTVVEGLQISDKVWETSEFSRTQCPGVLLSDKKIAIAIFQVSGMLVPENTGFLAKQENHFKFAPVGFSIKI